MKKSIYTLILVLLANFSAAQATEPTMEFGTISINHLWSPITFTKTYVDPIVIIAPPTRNGGNKSVVRMQSLTATGFDIRIQEWDYNDQWHMFEDVAYMVVERGRYTMPNGTILEAGSMELTNQTGKNKSFSAPLPTKPAVFANIVTNNDTSAVIERLKNITVDGFRTKMQEEEAADGIHATETLHFIAMETTPGTINDYEYMLGSELINHTTTTFEDFWSFEYIFADMQTLNGGNTASVRQNGDGTFSLFIEEEKSADNEVWHVNEEVA